MGQILGSNWVNERKESGINTQNLLDYNGDAPFGRPAQSKEFVLSMLDSKGQ